MRQLPVFTGPPRTAYDVTGPLPIVKGTCDRCSLKEGVRTVCMPAEVMGGSSGDTLLVVGQGPGEVEDRSGRPLVGPTGAYFRQLVSKFWKGPIVLDNAVRCFPGTRDIKPAMVEQCRPFGVHVFQGAKPARILALGTEAIRSIVGESYPPLSVRKGYAHTTNGTPVFFLIHPVMGLRNRFARAWFEEDLEWALQAQVRGLPTNALALMVTTREEAEAAAEDLRFAEWVTWDIETFGAAFNREFAVLNLALTPGGLDYSYVLERPALEDPHVFAPIRAVLDDRNVKKCGQGMKFDQVGMRAKFGVRTRCDFDTELIRRLYDSNAEANLEVMQPSVGMAGGKDEAHAHVAAGVAELQRLVRHKRKPPKKPKPVQPLAWSVTPLELEVGLNRIMLGDEYKRYAYAAIEPDVRSRYNAGDTISTDRLVQDAHASFKARPDVPLVWEKVGRQFTHAMTEMEFNGIYASREKVRELQAMCDEVVVRLGAELKKYGADFNPNSHPQVRKLLFEQLGLKPTLATESGLASVAEEVLEKIKHPVGKQILGYRRAVHFKSQYADGMEFYIQDDGRIHPSYKINGTGCMPVGELVLTNRGYLPVERVRVGDLVLSHLGRTRAVTALSTYAPTQIFKVTLSNGLQLRTSGNHQYRTPDGWVRADEMRKGQTVVAHSGPEAWKKVRGWPYEVSSWGRVRGLGAVLTLQPKGKWGHLKIALRRNGARVRGADYKDFPIHRLVRRAFGRLRGSDEVRHLNGVAWDNTIANLGVGTRRQNAQDSLRHGTARCGAGQQKLTEAQVQYVLDTPRRPARRPNAPGKTSATLALELGVSRELIDAIRRGKKRSYRRPSDTSHVSFFNEHVVRVEHEEVLQVVYGLTVDEDESHVTGGVVTHNTGRPSCEAPNLLNIPRPKTPDGKLCRAVFQAPPGKLLLEADYNQQELRVAAMLSGDQVMAEIFRSGEDFHLKTAKMIAPILDLDPSTITKEHALRDQAKIVNFSIIYGKAVKQLAEELGIPVTQAQEIFDAIIGKFRGLQAWRQEQVRLVQRLGYCRTWWDGEPFRVRPLWHIADSDENRRGTAERGSYNTPVQGTAAEFMNASLGAVQEWIEADHVPAKLVLTVYDSMMLELDEGAEHEVAYNVKRIMEGWNSKDVPVVAELKLGRVWGELQDYKVAS